MYFTFFFRISHKIIGRLIPISSTQIIECLLSGFNNIERICKRIMRDVSFTLLFLVLSVCLETANLTHCIHPFVHIHFILSDQIIDPLRRLDVKHVLIFLFAIFESKTCVHL